MANQASPRLDDPRRLAELSRFTAAALSAESGLPDIIEATRYAFRADLAALSHVGPETTCFGAGEDFAETTVPTRLAFCRKVVETGEPFIAKNLSVHPEFSKNPYVMRPPYIRFYAGVPVRSASGFVLGSYSVLSHEPSFRFEAEDLAALQRFASIALSMTSLQAELRDAA